MRIVRFAAYAAVVVTVAGNVLANGGLSFLRAAYPHDTVRREALQRCQAADPNFLRFSADERSACYARLHLS